MTQRVPRPMLAGLVRMSVPVGRPPIRASRPPQREARGRTTFPSSRWGGGGV